MYFTGIEVTSSHGKPLKQKTSAKRPDPTTLNRLNPHDLYSTKTLRTKSIPKSQIARYPCRNPHCNP